MSFIEIDAGNAIYYDHHPPAEGRATFVFCNSMGLSSKFWRSTIAPALRDRGFGTLVFDYRGQGESRYDDTATMEPDEIIGDILRVVTAVAPANPILVGIAVGGHYAAQAILRGAPARALILSNSLRIAGPHTEWLAELELRLLQMGGQRLANDALSPSAHDAAQLERMRPTHLLPHPYEPWPNSHPRVRIQMGMRKYDWNVRYEDLRLPVLVMTGERNRRCFTEDIDRILARMPDARAITFADAGLTLHKEIPDQLVETFTEFASGLAA